MSRNVHLCLPLFPNELTKATTCTEPQDGTDGTCLSSTTASGVAPSNKQCRRHTSQNIFSEARAKPRNSTSIPLRLFTQLNFALYGKIMFSARWQPPSFTNAKIFQEIVCMFLLVWSSMLSHGCRFGAVFCQSILLSKYVAVWQRSACFGTSTNWQS